MTSVTAAATPRIDDLADQAQLQRRLAAALSHARCKHVQVGLLVGDRVAQACVDDDAALPIGTPNPQVSTAALPLRAGCLTKLFTATLATDAAMLGELGVDESIGAVLGAVARGRLRGITIRRLLEHTHGLDDSRLQRAPLLADRRIDAERLLDELCAAPQLAAPGELYSYSNAGAWLIGAALERSSGRRYADLLRERLLAPLGIAADAGQRDAARIRVCPSLGLELRIALGGLLRFLARYALDDPRRWPGDERLGADRGIVPLPGWNALERGVHLGWKFHGAGWFGHQSNWPQASALVRVHPRRGIGLAVASRDQPASLIAAKLFGSLLPELFDLRAPAWLDAEQASGLDPERYVGLYGCAARRVVIERGTDSAALEWQLDERRARLAGRGPLQAAADDVFFAQSAQAPWPYVQFVQPRAGVFHYLWDGRCVLRRV